MTEQVPLDDICRVVGRLYLENQLTTERLSAEIIRLKQELEREQLDPDAAPGGEDG